MKIDYASMKKLLARVCRHFHVDGSLTIIITDIRLIKRLNLQFKGRNRSTDVLAFDLAERRSDNYLDGEIYVCLPQVRSQAAAERVRFEEEFERVCLHGLLHLLGYDDKSRQDRKLMWQVQESLLKGSMYGIKLKRRASRRKKQKEKT